MIDTKAAYKRQLETNVSVTLSMSHLSGSDVRILQDANLGQDRIEPIEVIINDEFRLMLKLSEDFSVKELKRLSQPLRQILTAFQVTGIRLVMFDVDAMVMEGFAVSDSRLELSRKILEYEGNESVLDERIEHNEMVMVIPSEAVVDCVRTVRDLTRPYTEYDPVTAKEILELHRLNGSKVMFA